MEVGEEQEQTEVVGDAKSRRAKEEVGIDDNTLY